MFTMNISCLVGILIGRKQKAPVIEKVMTMIKKAQKYSYPNMNLLPSGQLNISLGHIFTINIEWSKIIIEVYNVWNPTISF
jgi:hypothetical protein